VIARGGELGLCRVEIDWLRSMSASFAPEPRDCAMALPIPQRRP
jgi:hypothetical protein